MYALLVYHSKKDASVVYYDSYLPVNCPILNI